MSATEQESFVRMVGRHWKFITLSLVSTVVYLGVSAFIEMHNAIFPPQSVSNSSRLVAMSFGGREVKIPRNYITSWTRDEAPGAFLAVRLEAMLPDFKPVGAIDSNEWYRLMQEEQVVVGIIISADQSGRHGDSAVLMSRIAEGGAPS